MGAILEKFPPGARRWAKKILDASASPGAPVSSGAPILAVETDLLNQIAVLSARVGSMQLGEPPTTLGSGDFITRNNGCCVACS